MITGNRNDESPDSLEATIRNENQPDSLPVITIADSDRVLRDRLYAEKVADDQQFGARAKAILERLR